MIKLQTCFMLLLMLESLNFQCSLGCLKCDSSNQCVFCDYSNGYVLSNGTCKNEPVNNCLHYSASGTCLQCKESYYVTS